MSEIKIEDMALVRVQRSQSVVGTPSPHPQCISDNSEADVIGSSKNRKMLESESFFAGKGTVLALKDIPRNTTERRLSTDSTMSANSTQSSNSDIQLHLQSMFYLLRQEETLKMAVKLESQRSSRTRYLAIASRCVVGNDSKKVKHKNVASKSTNAVNFAHDLSSANLVLGHKLSFEDDKMPKQESSLTENEKLAYKRKSTLNSRTTISGNKNKLESLRTEKLTDTNYIEESCLLGIDCNEKTTIGLVVPILADTRIHLDGDGGFSVSVFGKTHIFKPVSVQAMWSALQTLHKVSQKARALNFYPGGPSHDWVSYYENCIESEQSCLNEWNAMDALESKRPPSPDAIRNKPTQKEETKRVIRTKLKEIMMSVDLDEVTSKYIRSRLEDLLDMDLGEYKSFIDEEMLTILGQMDAPTEIFDHVYLGSEWNASNLEELQKNGVRHILNVTREIDNFFPGIFDYFNVRVYDDEKTNLLKHWDNTYKYITRAKAEGSKVLVHCKMGVSRSASVVIAYAMKAYNWEFNYALEHVKKRRNCVKPNKNFLAQLETYRGMLDAMKNKEKLQRSKSETNLKSTKDARLLPGSEPTPLIQALNQSKKSENGEQRKVFRRSSSFLPRDIQNFSGMKKQCQSLENLMPFRGKPDEQKNVRFPGSNGQNYSVTQNQVLHIQKSCSSTSVRTIVSGWELNDMKPPVNRRGVYPYTRNCSRSECIKKTENLKSVGIPVWISSSKLIQQTSNIVAGLDLTHRPKNIGNIFSSQINKLFSHEGARQSQEILSCKVNINKPPDLYGHSSNSVEPREGFAFPDEHLNASSRYSTSISDDNSVSPTRNDSLDTGRYAAILEREIENCTWKSKGSSSEKFARAFHSISIQGREGINENNVPLKNCSDCGKKSTVQNISSSNSCNSNKSKRNVILNRSNLTSHRPHRCKSEENIIKNRGLNDIQKLSASVPDSFSFSCFNNLNFNTHKHPTSEEKNCGNVQILKKNFEAKTHITSPTNQKGKSLPSSPVAKHNDNTRQACNTKKEDNCCHNGDINVKCLVNKYQSSPESTSAHQPYFIFSSTPQSRPRSFYDSRKCPNFKMDVPGTYKTLNDYSKASASPTMKSNLSSSIVATGDILTQHQNYRRVQQHGRTHPLAKLSLSKQSFNTAAYNTM